ncbi:MAG: hypothetical protein J6C46_11750 [Clostridia bacterium]|nr:hypothetical protein [Clostridia bacterium]
MYVKMRVCIVLLTISLLCGCVNEEAAAPEIDEYCNYDELISKEQFVEEKSYGDLSGMVCKNKDIFVVSKQDNCVLKYSNDGELLKKIGMLGNGDGELSRPVAICEFDNMIYVADENDGRIQVFDLEGNYKNKYCIDELNDSYVSILDIVVDTKKIYISVATFKKNLMYIYVIDKSNGEYEKLGKSCMGVLGKDVDNNIYFAQSFEYYEDSNSNGYEDGESYISTVVDGNVVKLFQLPEQYSPSDVTVYNNQIYVFSRAYTQIDVFELNGTYVRTVFSESSSVSNRGLGYMDIDENGVIYLSDNENGIIYKVDCEK